MHQFNRQILKVPANLILWATKYECLDEVAMFLLFKRVHRSGHFHSMKVPQQLGISRPTFNKYVKLFVNNGWAQKLHHGFKLFSINTVQKMVYQVDSKYCFNRFVKLKNYENKFNLITQLRWIVLHHKYDQIKFAKICKSEGISYSGKRLSKASRKIVMSRDATVAMSICQIGESFRRSAATGSRVKQELKWMKMLKAKSQESNVIMSNCTVEDWIYFRDSTWKNSHFRFSRKEEYTNGVVFENLPDKITLSNPLFPTLNNNKSYFLQKELIKQAYGKS